MQLASAADVCLSTLIHRACTDVRAKGWQERPGLKTSFQRLPVVALLTRALAEAAQLDLFRGQAVA